MPLVCTFRTGSMLGRKNEMGYRVGAGLEG